MKVLNPLLARMTVVLFYKRSYLFSSYRFSSSIKGCPKSEAIYRQRKQRMADRRRGVNRMAETIVDGSKEIESSSVSSSGRSRRRVVLIRKPIREDIYEGPKVYCHHRLVAPRWTAWINGNPGERFYGCLNYYRDDGCGFFAWHNCDFGERANIVIKQLLDDIDKLYDENTRLREGNDDVGLFEEIDSIYDEVRKLKNKYEIRKSEARNWQRKFKCTVAILIMTWICLFFLYMSS